MDAPVGDETREPVPACFLCEPRVDLIYAETTHFIAMLGLGPVVEGYSLVATRAHTPSMLDLDLERRLELIAFTNQVRERLSSYGESIVTEHGRVPPCLGSFVRQHEPHCLHAHRLVFPGAPQFDLATVAPRLSVQRFSSLVDAASLFRGSGQYLAAEHPDASIELASVQGPFPRQFFRRVVASLIGDPWLADWRAHPRPDVIHAARRRVAA